MGVPTHTSPNKVGSDANRSTRSVAGYGSHTLRIPRSRATDVLSYEAGVLGAHRIRAYQERLDYIVAAPLMGKRTVVVAFCSNLLLPFV